jgi:POT family proton-dependent oligopeptide transporter
MASVTADPANPQPIAHRSLFGHPPGLTILFLTQMWAEFSYFGLQALLVYYMTGQLHFSQYKSSMIFGVYGGAAFFSPFFGGMIADKWLGRTRSVVAGGVLMMLGHFAMAFPPLLFPALALVALGNGLFIPPLAVQVGALYGDDDPRKAHAFSAYYMGINLGGLLAPLVCGSLGELLGWHWGFAAAGIGMFAGLVIYLGFRRLLPADPRAKRHANRDGIPPAIDARAVRLLIAIVAVVILFRIAYEQSGNVIALWVRDETDRSLFGLFTIPATWFQAINPLGIIIGTPLLIRRWSRHKDRAGAAQLMRRMSLGCVVAGGAMLVMVFAAIVNQSGGEPVSLWWTIVYFILLTIGELLVIPVGRRWSTCFRPRASRRPRWAPGISPNSWAPCSPA